jgi:hypothetical protein
MNVLMIGQHAGVFRDLDSVMRELCRRGHAITFLQGSHGDEEQVPEIAGVTRTDRPAPSEAWQRRLRVGRHVINRGIYWRRNHPSPERVVASIEDELPGDVRAKIQTPLWRSAVGTRAALRVWRWLEAASPVSRTVDALLKETTPDVMLVSPVLGHKDPIEADYLHAGRTRGIPTIGYTNSWDDWTSLGTAHVVPNIFLTWNAPMAREAVALHDIPASTIRITGVPHLDAFFSRRVRGSRADVCATMRCPNAPYVMFLGSPRTIWDDESFLVKALADGLGREFNDRAPTLVVRPHPTNPGPFTTFGHPGVVIHHDTGSPESVQEYYDQLAHATCVFGLNTPAFLEAVIADRPCLTIVSDTYWPAQGRTGHFRHLLNGQFLTLCSSASDVARRVRGLIDGGDETAAGRKQFARSFLRPCGLDSAASDVIADIMESAARPRADSTPVRDARRPLIPGLTLAEPL